MSASKTVGNSDTPKCKNCNRTPIRFLGTPSGVMRVKDGSLSDSQLLKECLTEMLQPQYQQQPDYAQIATFEMELRDAVKDIVRDCLREFVSPDGTVTLHQNTNGTIKASMTLVKTEDGKMNADIDLPLNELVEKKVREGFAEIKQNLVTAVAEIIVDANKKRNFENAVCSVVEGKYDVRKKEQPDKPYVPDWLKPAVEGEKR